MTRLPRELRSTSLSRLPHTELIGKLKAGDPEAFRQLMAEEGDRVYRTCLGYVRNQTEAEDLTQEVFLEAFRSIGQFRQEAKLSTWLYRIATTKFLELNRRKNRQKRKGQVVELGSAPEPMNPAGDLVHPAVALENQERSRVLFAAVDQLPENQRTAWTLNQVEGLKAREVAEIMELSLSAVEALLVRARRKLRELLRDYYEKTMKS